MTVSLTPSVRHARFVRIHHVGFSPYIGINLDIGHFTARGLRRGPVHQKNHARITNIHLKDHQKSKRQHPTTNIAMDNFPWGPGDTPIKAVLSS